MTVKTKSTSEELFEHFLRVPIPSDSKPFDYVRKTHEIYKPKLFTSEITWFSPEIKLPVEGDEIIFFSDNCFYIGGLTDYSAIDEPDVFSHNEGSMKISEIKYWAYLPSFPEIE